MERYSRSPSGLSLPEIDNYETVELLGVGGFGFVYKAIKKGTAQFVAVKVMDLQRGLDINQIRRHTERFKRETDLCARLTHPNIVRLVDKGECSGRRLYAVFEYVRGKTLKDFILQNGALPAKETGCIMGQVLEGLVGAHQLGIVHRDLKPHNIIVRKIGSYYQVKILDFGIGACVPEARCGDYRTITLTEETVGTPSYSAPEQLRGEPPTVKSDIYAWGLLFLECLTGYPSVRGETLAETCYQQLSQKAVPLPVWVATHPVGELLQRVLEKRTKTRWGDTEAIFKKFDRIDLSDIVGDSKKQEKLSDKFPSEAIPNTIDTVTQLNCDCWGRPTIQKKQLSVLCFSIRVQTPDLGQSGVGLALDTAEMLHKEQINLYCKLASRFGGFEAGRLGGTALFYYGYKQVSDNDTLLAAHTALEIISKIAQHKTDFQRRGVLVTARVGIHVGMVSIFHGETPNSYINGIAMWIEQRANFGSVVVSEDTVKYLKSYFNFKKIDARNASEDQQVLEVYALLEKRH